MESNKRQEALNQVEKDYNDKDSSHYRDNERHRWAVGLINERFDKEERIENEKKKIHAQAVSDFTNKSPLHNDEI